LGNYQTPSRPWSVWPGSVAGELYALAEDLADTFSWPGRDAAARFVLTGSAPLMRPVDARLIAEGDESPGRQLRVELSVSPWVPAEEVARAYRRMQRHVLGDRNRLPSAKTLEVARFVWEQEMTSRDRKPKWRDLLERWNKEDREKDQKDQRGQFRDYRHFRTYFERGAGAVRETNLDCLRDDKRGPSEADHAATVQQPGLIS
jgi:hypothetical protein